MSTKVSQEPDTIFSAMFGLQLSKVKALDIETADFVTVSLI